MELIQCAELGLEEIGLGTQLLLRMSVVALLARAVALHERLTHLGLLELAHRRGLLLEIRLSLRLVVVLAKLLHPSLRSLPRVLHLAPATVLAVETLVLEILSSVLRNSLLRRRVVRVPH